MKGFIEPHTAYRVRLALVLDTDSVVAQEHANDCDVTVILSRYQRTGQLPAGRGPGAYEDVSALCGADYSGVLSAVASAQEAVSSAQRAESEALQKVKAFEAVPPAEPPVPAS
nr:MAG: internal scaffolding protein [Microvirus sp.]